MNAGARTRWLLRIAFPATLAVLCTPAAAGSSDEAADRRAIETLNERWVQAYRQGDYGAIPPLYTENALIMPRGRPAIEGRAALAGVLGGLAAGREVRIHFDILELEILGDHAWLVSRFTVRYGPPDTPGQKEVQHGRSMIIYRRGEDGRWRIHRDMDSPAPAP